MFGIECIRSNTYRIHADVSYSVETIIPLCSLLYERSSLFLYNIGSC